MLPKAFGTLEAYRASERSGYRLLPFRFTRLDDERYVVSNIVGEFHVLGREMIERLVTHRLEPSSSIYDDLKATHFIYDDDSKVAHALLGLKYRTKRARLPHFTALHMFVVTLRCDYTCKYCQVSRQTEDKSAFDMTAEAAEKAVDLVFKSPSPAIKIEFQGGEPLLNFERIKQVVDLAIERNKIENRSLQFVIASNLSLISDEILEFCASNNIYLSTSLDGPAELHNANRPRPGKNGHRLTVEGIAKARDRLGIDGVSALMTTTERSLPLVKNIIDEYVRLRFTSIFLRPLSPYGFAVKTGQAALYDSTRWLEFYKEGLRYILDLNKNGYLLEESYSAIVLRKILTPQAPGYVDLQSPAGIGISAVVYNYDGTVYASDEGRMLAEMGSDRFKLGNILTDSYEEIFASEPLLSAIEDSFAESSPQCSECAFVDYCGSDPVYHFATQGHVNGNKANSGFCTKNMGVFRHLITLLEDSPEDREILLRWAWGR
jgi:His-Xaa-Ser system radical SAM maturase HxsB